jgi:hypothetical protein
MYSKIHKVGRSMYTVTSVRPLYPFVLTEVWQDLEPIDSQKNVKGLQRQRTLREEIQRLLLRQL